MHAGLRHEAGPKARARDARVLLPPVFFPTRRDRSGHGLFLFGQNGVRLLPRTHRTAGFAVLTSPDIPAALVELGYLSNVQDEKLLTVRQHQLALARALRASIDAHFAAGAAIRKA